MGSYLSLLRVHQYIKNLFIFAPLFFAFSFEIDSFFRCLIAFVCFSCVASAVYIFNDFRDIQSDRLHPKKKCRPLASGKISPKKAFVIAFALLLVGGGGIHKIRLGVFISS